MPTPWLKRIKETGQLTVFNKATAWTDSIHAAMTTFNGLSMGVKLVNEQQEKSANIVIILANGPQQYKYYGDIADSGSDFTADSLSGETSALIDKRMKAIFFAAIFLPGKIPKATKDQKQVVVVHEFIHASGMPGEHEDVGIMFPQMKESGSGLIEYLPDQDAKPMPPIRLGPQTRCKIQMVWSGASCP